MNRAKLDMSVRAFHIMHCVDLFSGVSVTHQNVQMSGCAFRPSFHVDSLNLLSKVAAAEFTRADKRCSALQVNAGSGMVDVGAQNTVVPTVLWTGAWSWQALVCNPCS